MHICYTIRCWSQHMRIFFGGSLSINDFQYVLDYQTSLSNMAAEIARDTIVLGGLMQGVYNINIYVCDWQYFHSHFISYSSKWGLMFQKQASRAGNSNHISQYLWDVITCPFHWCLWHTSPQISLKFITIIPLTDWGLATTSASTNWVTQGLHDGLSPVRRQSITQISDVLLLIWIWRANLIGIKNKIIWNQEKAFAWLRHQMETFSALRALCARNSPVPGLFPAPRPVTRSFDVFFICAWMNGWVNNRDAGDLRRHRTHYDVTLIWKCLLSDVSDIQNEIIFTQAKALINVLCQMSAIFFRTKCIIHWHAKSV